MIYDLTFLAMGNTSIRLYSLLSRKSIESFLGPTLHRSLTASTLTRQVAHANIYLASPLSSFQRCDRLHHKRFPGILLVKLTT
jgi:hypothetical protein